MKQERSKAELLAPLLLIPGVIRGSDLPEPPAQTSGDSQQKAPQDRDGCGVSSPVVILDPVDCESVFREKNCNGIVDIYASRE